jgi:hypothetical protein
METQRSRAATKTLFTADERGLTLKNQTLPLISTDTTDQQIRDRFMGDSGF